MRSESPRMEKMFYSLEEAAAKLGKGVDDVRQMAARGQLQEFRDRDKMMFKKEQVDLLAGGAEDDMIPLAADSGELEPLSAASSGTGVGLDGGKSDTGTGISIVDTDSTDDADANAVTRVTAAPGALVDPGEKSGSGGLPDLTKEADDTSLGAGLLEDVYGGDTVAQQTAQEPAIPAGDAGVPSQLFETPAAVGASTEMSAMAFAPMAEAYDGRGSVLVGGFALGMLVAALSAAFVLILGLTSTAGSGVVNMIGDMWWIGAALAVVPILGGVIGFFMKKN